MPYSTIGDLSRYAPRVRRRRPTTGGPGGTTSTYSPAPAASPTSYAPPPPSLSSILSGPTATFQSPQTVPPSQLVQRVTRQGQRDEDDGPGRAPQARPRRPGMVGVDIPDFVPKQFRRPVAIQGQRLNKPLREAGVNMSGPEYLARLIQFESNWDEDVEGPPISHLGGVTAKKLGQFIPSTAEDFRQRLGVDPEGTPKQQIRAAAMHASGDFGYQPLYAGYNPGYSSQDPITQPLAGRLPAPGQGMTTVRAPRKALRRTAQGRVATGSPSRGGGSSPLDRSPGDPLPGPWQGSRNAVRRILGDDLMQKIYQGESGYSGKRSGTVGGHSSTGSLHHTSQQDAFAADIPPNQRYLDEISERLGFDEPIQYGTRLSEQPTIGGYQMELLPYTHGSGPHIHLGARYTGGQPRPGQAGGPGSTGGFAPSGGGGGGGFTPAAGPAPTDDLPEFGLQQLLRGGGGGGGGLGMSPLVPAPPRPGGLLFEDEDEEDEEESLLAQILGLRR